MLQDPDSEQGPMNAAGTEDKTVSDADSLTTKQRLAERYTTEFGPPANERRQPTVFAVEDFSFHSSSPSPTHWSIGWSDLMMTMFILFLTLFVYQATHKQFLISKQTEVVGGETTQAVEVAPKGSATAKFAAIKPSLPLITGGTIKKVEPIHVEDIGPETKYFSDKDREQMEKVQKGLAPPAVPSGKNDREQQAIKTTEEEAEMVFSAGQDTSKTRPSEQKPAVPPENINRLFGRISSTINAYNLSKYATVDLISGKAIHIVLTSDLFFNSGKAVITPNSMASLEKLGAAIKSVPFMIDIVGHTDSHYKHSDRYPSNWELSVARASSVARFFIEEMEMNPNQFVVSGFSSYRPLYPNTTARNRAANRRIDVIISNKYPEPVAATNRDEGQ